MNAIMFVDNTDLFLTGETNEHHTSITSKAQQLTSKWCSMLRITGGALCPEKCRWYLLSFKWTSEGDWSYKKIRDTPAEVYIPDHHNIHHKIKCYEAAEGVKGLGIFGAPDENNTNKLEYMKKNTKLDGQNKINIHQPFCSFSCPLFK